MCEAVSEPRHHHLPQTQLDCQTEEFSTVKWPLAAESRSTCRPIKSPANKLLAISSLNILEWFDTWQYMANILCQVHLVTFASRTLSNKWILPQLPFKKDTETEKGVAGSRPHTVTWVRHLISLWLQFVSAKTRAVGQFCFPSNCLRGSEMCFQHSKKRSIQFSTCILHPSGMVWMLWEDTPEYQNYQSVCVTITLLWDHSCLNSTTHQGVRAWSTWQGTFQEADNELVPIFLLCHRKEGRKLVLTVWYYIWISRERWSFVISRYYPW